MSGVQKHFSLFLKSLEIVVPARLYEFSPILAVFLIRYSQEPFALIDCYFRRFRNQQLVGTK